MENIFKKLKYRSQLWEGYDSHIIDVAVYTGENLSSQNKKLKKNKHTSSFNFALLGYTIGVFIGIALFVISIIFSVPFLDGTKDLNKYKINLEETNNQELIERGKYQRFIKIIGGLSDKQIESIIREAGYYEEKN